MTTYSYCMEEATFTKNILTFLFDFLFHYIVHTIMILTTQFFSATSKPQLRFTVGHTPQVQLGHRGQSTLEPGWLVHRSNNVL